MRLRNVKRANTFLEAILAVSLKVGRTEARISIAMFHDNFRPEITFRHQKKGNRLVRMRLHSDPEGHFWTLFFILSREVDRHRLRYGQTFKRRLLAAGNFPAHFFWPA